MITSGAKYFLSALLLCWATFGAETVKTPFGDELAKASPEQRATLLKANPDKITSLLAGEMSDRAVDMRYEGKFAAGLDLASLALTLAERAGDQKLTQRCLHNLGFFQKRVGKIDDAIVSYKRAITIAEERKDPASALTHMVSLASAYLDLGDSAGALQTANRALEGAREFGNGSEEVRARNVLGRTHEGVGRYGEAAAQYLKGLEVDERLQLDQMIGTLANNLGTIYVEQGNFELALPFYRRGLEVLEKVKDPDVSILISNLARLYQHLGQDKDAIEMAQRGLQMARQLDPTNTMVALRALGQIEKDQKKYQAAITHLSEAAGIAKEKEPMAHADLLTTIGAAQRGLGEPKTALKTLDVAIAEARQFEDEETTGHALDEAGAAAMATGEKERARQYSIQAIQSYERQRDEAAGGEDVRAEYYEQMLSPFYRLARLEADAGKVGRALEIAEQARSRVLSEVMESGHVSVTRSITAEEQLREKGLRAAVGRAAKGKDRDAARTEYRAFLDALYSKQPELRMNRGRAEPMSAARAAAVAPDRMTVFLQYLVTPEETLLFTVSRDNGIRLFRVRLPETEIRKRVNAYREMLAAKDLDYRETAASLYRLLVGPAEAELTGRTSVVILPSGPLWELPFQALTRGDGRFVGETLAVSYAPSVTVLAALAKRPRVTTVSKVLAMAQGMPEAEEEANAVAAMYGTRAFTGAAARESTFKSQAAGYGILHLASHGVFENGSPMYSYIALGKDGAEDGRLEAAELMNMELKARLAILSACETARGRIGAGEGVMGLTWALAVAGVPTTIASGWKVDSKVTAELMVELHRGLRAGLGPAEALRKASMKVMAQPSYRHPFYWASFGVYGLGW